MTENKNFFLKKKKLFRVQCAFDNNHVFDKMLEVEESDEPVISEVETFCPLCGKMVSFNVKGKTVPDSPFLKDFEEQDKRLGRKKKKFSR